MFVSDHPVEGKVTYNFYNIHFKEQFDYAFKQHKMDVFSKIQSQKLERLYYARMLNGMQFLNFQCTRNAKKLYDELKTAKDNKDENEVAMYFDGTQKITLPHILVK